MASDWQQRFRQASFRGVQFFVDRHEFETGRRAVQYEFPNKDVPFSEDLGRKGATFQIDGYVLGANYFQQRDFLIAAFEQEGPGDLVHPYLGTKKVQCSSVRFTESKGETRIVTFSATFLEAGVAAFPDIGTDNVSKISALADKVNEAAVQNFVNVFKVANFAQGTVDKARKNVHDGITAFMDSTQGVSNLNSNINSTTYDLLNLQAEADDLTSTPGDLADRFVDSIQLLASVGGTDEDSLQILGTLLTYGNSLTPIPPTTISRMQQQVNQDAVTNLIQQVALAESARLSALVPFESFEDAVIEREVLGAVLETQSLATTDDEVFQSLADLNGGLVEALPDLTADLPRLIHYTPPSTYPALALVYNLFESIEKEADLIARNDIRHPGFVPGGVELEVLGE